jgi:dihydroorotate dehydrogenase electron transfer subunit
LRLTEPRTLAPPERRTAHVTSVHALGAYVVIRALDAAGPRDPQPGQFYMLSTSARWGAGTDERPYLPRAFSYARARDGELSFLLEAVGPGTARLAELREGEGLELLGPLGVGWRPPAPGTQPVLVGGGIGVAPLLCLQDELGPQTPTLLGFRSAAHAEAATMFAGAPELATDDGSAGRQALVTDLLRERLDGDRDATVFACGPPAMLEAVRLLGAQLGVPAQLALESGMACGFGACFGCVVATVDGYVRLCVDGPVLDSDQVMPA